MALEPDGPTTPEYVALQKNLPALSQNIAPYVTLQQLALVQELQAVGVVVAGNYFAAGDLLRNALDSIQNNPTLFYALLGVLENKYKDSCYKTLKSMKDTFVDELKKYFTSKEVSSKVFISYNWEASSTKSNEVYTMLTKAGVRVWVDTRGIEAGEVITDEIFSALTMCDFIIPMVTRKYAQSIWCLRELYFVLCTKKEGCIIPIVYEDRSVVEQERSGKWLWAKISFQKYVKDTKEGMHNLLERIEPTKQEQ